MKIYRVAAVLAVIAALLLNIMAPASTVKGGRKVSFVILNVLLTVAAVLLLIIAIPTLFFDDEDVFLFGYKPFVVSSESMDPQYKKYALVVIKCGTYDEVAVGDLIAFRADRLSGQPAFHRVIEITEHGFLTKGDNNKLQDSQVVNEGMFLGKEVWHTNATAAIILQLQTSKGFFMLIILPFLGVLLLIIFIKMIKDVWNNKC